jgi:hypothetical protein
MNAGMRTSCGGTSASVEIIESARGVTVKGDSRGDHASIAGQAGQRSIGHHESFAIASSRVLSNHQISLKRFPVSSATAAPPSRKARAAPFAVYHQGPLHGHRRNSAQLLTVARVRIERTHAAHFACSSGRPMRSRTGING